MRGVRRSAEQRAALQLARAPRYFSCMARRRRFNEFDKRCSTCGRLISEAEWKRLLFLGFQVIPPWRDDPGEVLELRNDTCGSTLARLAPFTPTALEIGAQHELEHTKDLKMARRIAADHLYEDPMYYEKLEAAGL